MKVLKKGRKQKGWAVTRGCTGNGNGNGGCGAQLLVEEGDVYITTSNARDETTTYYTFRCPECGVQTDLEGLRLPAHVKDKARTNKDPGKAKARSG
jgi:hypothetical protein